MGLTAKSRCNHDAASGRLPVKEVGADSTGGHSNTWSEAAVYLVRCDEEEVRDDSLVTTAAAGEDA